MPDNQPTGDCAENTPRTLRSNASATNSVNAEIPNSQKSNASNTNGPSVSTKSMQEPTGSANAASFPDLKVMVTQIVKQVLGGDKQNNLQGPPRDMQQLVNQATIQLTNEVDKIPDLVQNLREFSGSQSEFDSWNRSVHRVLEIYRPFLNTPKYFAILSAIRNKITGSADLMLEANNVALNWADISSTLALHYGDKRDVGTLEFQMSRLYQGNRPLVAYNEKIHTYLSLLTDKVLNMDLPGEARVALINKYKQKALDIFIRGLGGDLPRLLLLKSPKDLPEALDCCLKLENQATRSSGIDRNSNYRNEPRQSQYSGFQTNAHVPPNRTQQYRSQFNRYPSRQRSNFQAGQAFTSSQRNFNRRPVNGEPSQQARNEGNFHINIIDNADKGESNLNTATGTELQNCHEYSDVHFLA